MVSLFLLCADQTWWLYGSGLIALVKYHTGILNRDVARCNKGTVAIEGLHSEFGGKELAMGYLVYELDAVKNLPKDHRDRVESIRRRLEEEKVAVPETGASLPFFEALGDGFFKKRVGRFRLIAVLRFVRWETGEHPVVVFLDFLSRSDPRYVEGGPEKLEKLRQQYLPVLEARLPEIERWVRESLTQRTPKATLPSPPEDLLEVLQPLRPQEKVSAVYESRLWREGIERLETATERAAVLGLPRQTSQQVHRRHHLARSPRLD